MKVLSILPEATHSSGMIFARRQIDLLAGLGVENRTFIFPSSRLSPLKLLRTWFNLVRSIWSFRPDIVHVHYGLIYAFVAAYMQFRPLVITFQGSDLNYIQSKSWLRNFFNLFLSNMATLRAGTIICVSRNLSKRLWWGRRKAVIIPPGIDTTAFQPMERKICRQKLNWPENEKVILFNANNPGVKRLDLAEETLLLVREEMSNVRLEILRGDLPDDDLIPVIINAADCLLICSDSEGSPTMVKEAMACNIPVVGVDVGDVKERLKDVTGSLVVEKKPSELAFAVLEIMRRGLPSDGRKKLIADGLSASLVAQKLYRIYRFRVDKKRRMRRFFHW